MPSGSGFGGGGGGSSSPRGSGFGGGTATKQKAKAKAAPKKPGLLGQLSDIIKATPSGLWNLTKEVGAEFDPLQRKTLGAMKDPKFKSMSAAEKRRALSPATASFAESAGRTAGDIRHPSRLKKAADEGQIVGKIIEDAANLSLVAGPAAKAATAGASRAAVAGAPRTAAVLGKSATVLRGAEHAANLTAGAGDPIFLTTRLAGAAKKGLASDAVRGSSLGLKASEKAAAFGERRAARQDIADIDANISKEQDRQGRIVAAQKELLPSAAEVEATTLIRQGESKALARLDSLPPVERQKVLEAAFPKGREVSAEAFELARAYETGRMPAEQRARFDEAIALVEREQQAPRTAREVAGTGRKEGPLSPEQLGDQPLTPVVAKATTRLRQQADRARENAERLRRRADQAEWQAATVRADLADVAQARGESRSVRRAEQQRSSLAAQAERAELRAVEAADRLTTLQDRAEAAKVAPPRSTAEGSALAAVTKAAGTRRLASHEMVTGERRILPSMKKMSAAEGRIDTAGERLSAAARRNGGVERGRATERAVQGERLVRLESRRARTLRAKEATVAADDPRPVATPGESRTLGATETRARILGNVARSAETRAARQQRTLEFVHREVSKSIEAAPKRFRPALQRAADSSVRLRQLASDAERAGDPHSAAYLRSVADDLPKVIDDLTAAGIDPSHLIGGENPVFIGGAGGRKQRFPTLRKTGGEKQSKTTNLVRSAEGQGRLEARRAGEAIKNVGAVEFRTKYGKSAADLGLDPALVGDDLKQAAAAAGYKPFDVGALLEGPPKIDHDTVFIRTAMADDFSRWFDGGRPGRPTMALHRINRAVSIPILRLSPRWQVGNAVSQALQLSVGAGLSPADIAVFGRQAAKMLKEAPEQVPARFGHSGQFAGILSPDLDALGNPVKGPRTPVGKLAEKSGQLNDWVDRWGKETVYLAKKAKGYSDEAAVKRALEVQVDMRRLSNFERNYVQAVFPYYAWAKHITQLSLRLPLEHPTRVAWTLHLADVYGDDQSGLPEWLKGGIRLPDGRFLNVGSVVNPFGDVGSSPLLSPGGAAAALSPFFRLAGAAVNVDVPHGQLLKRPVGTGPMDPSGKPRLGPIPPSEFANIVAQSFPQSRLATGVVGTPVSRYPTGDPYVSREGETYPTGRTRLNYLGRFAGIPTPEKIDAEDIQSSAAERRAAIDKQRANYEKRRAGGSTSTPKRGRGFGNR